MKFQYLIQILLSILIISSCSQPDQPNNCTTRLVSEVSNPQRSSDVLHTDCDGISQTQLIDKVEYGSSHMHRTSLLVSVIQIATILATIYGLVILRKTFHAADKTANAAINADSALMLCNVDFELIYPKAYRPDLTERQKLSACCYIKPNITIGNYGRTPARDVELRILIQPLSLNDKMRIEPAREYSPLIKYPIFKQSIEAKDVDLPDYINAIGNIFDQDYELYYVWVEIEYKDVFGYPDNLPKFERLKFTCTVNMTYVAISARRGGSYPSEANTHVSKFEGSIIDRLTPKPS